jgi:hypothetical protein
MYCAPQSAVCRSSENHHGGHTCAVPQTRRFELSLLAYSQRMMAPGMAWCLAGSEMEACTAKHADRDACRTSAGGACQARKRLLIRTSAVREWSGPSGCRAGVDGLPQLLTVQYWTSWSVRTHGGSGSLRTARILGRKMGGSKMGPAQHAGNEGAADGRACRIRSVDLTIRKWQREERAIANKPPGSPEVPAGCLAVWLPLCLPLPPQLCVRGNWALPDKLQHFYTCTSRRASPTSRRRRSGGSRSNNSRRNVLCCPTNQPASGPQTTHHHQMDRPASKGKVRSEGRVLQ